MSIKRFGKNLKTVREILSINKAYLYEETGISTKRIGLIENGTLLPTEDEIKIICDYLILTKKFMFSYRKRKDIFEYLKKHELYESNDEIRYYKKRKCLRCNKTFKSFSNCNRICDICKTEIKEKKIDKIFDFINSYENKNEYKTNF